MKAFKSIVIAALMLLIATASSFAQSAQIDAASSFAIDRDLQVSKSAKISSHIGNTYDIDCYDTHHKLVWHRRTHNMLTTVGANIYLNSTIVGGVPVAAEAEGNTGGTATSVTLTLLQDQNGQTSTIMPGSLTSLTIASYTGTFSDDGKGNVICTGTCTNFTAANSVIVYATGVVTLKFSASGPNANAGTATYSYLPTKWYVSLLYGASLGSFATTDTLSSNGWSPGAETTGTQITNATRPQFIPGTVSAGSVSNSGSVAVFTGNATVTLQGIIFVNSSTLAGTTGTLMGEATFTAAPIAAGYTINITVTDAVTAG